MILYPFQREAKEAVLRHWESGRGAALVSLPTGSGKTIVFSDILRSTLEKSAKRGLVLVHRDELLRQGMEKLRLIWPEARLSTVEAGYQNYSGQVTLGSVMSVVRHLERLPPIEEVVTDEAHHAPAKSWLKIYQQVQLLNPGWRHLGVTATPIRAKGSSDLEAIFGKPVYVKSIFELIVQGYLSPLKGLEVRTEVSVEDVRVSGGDFVAEELSRAINTRDRNRLVVENYLELASGRKALVFAADLAHARDLTEMFKAYGASAGSISGDTPPHIRRSMLQSLRDGALKVVVNCMVFTEGFDEPSLDAILVARPTRSLGLYCQMIGRGLRPYPGKKDCLFIDFVDNSRRHRLISMQDLLLFYRTRQTEKRLADMLGRRLEEERRKSLGQRGARGSFIDLSPTKLPLLVSLENLSSTVKEIDLFGLDAFAWKKFGSSHYVHVTGDLSLTIKPDGDGYLLFAVFPKEGLFAPLSDAPGDFDLAYGCGNAYLFDYGDRYLATRGGEWRLEEPSAGQKGLFERISGELSRLSQGRIKFPRPVYTKGEYSVAITAAQAEKIMFSGKKITGPEARELIQQRVQKKVAEEIPITIKSSSNSTLEAALRRAVATFSEAKDGDFRIFLKRLLCENQIFLDGNTLKIGHAGFPHSITQRQLAAAREAIARELRLYAPEADVVFSRFPAGEPEWS